VSAPAFRLVDSTLRDGSHAVRHSFTADQVRSVASRLAQAGVPVIEVAHGDGLGGSSMNYGFSTVRDVDLVGVAREAAPGADVAVLLIPGIGTVDHLREAQARGATVVRVATHCTEADVAEQHLRVARELGMTALGFLMMSHAIEPGALADQARVMQDAGAEAVYVVDSAGAMLPDDVVARVVALRDRLDVGVGVHTHNNLSMALANTLAAIAEGAGWVDASTRGLGAGAGNCATEALATVCDRAGIPTGLDAFALADVAEDVVAPLMHRPLLVDRAALTLGYAGVYSSFLLHAERAAGRFGVDARRILVELGRRGVVGGQEDMIIDVAVELAA
jgi:4-hydroxy 2-oxovalerate aldolase